MTTPTIMNTVAQCARNAGQQYTNLRNAIFLDPFNLTADEKVTGLGTNAGKYFATMTALLAAANAYDTTIVASALQTYPNTVTINNDGTVTLS